MDSILLTTRWGASRHIVRVDKKALTNWSDFRRIVLGAYPIISRDAQVTFHILIAGAGADPSALTEVEICDVTDLSALRTGDLVALKVTEAARVPDASAAEAAAAVADNSANSSSSSSSTSLTSPSHSAAQSGSAAHSAAHHTPVAAAKASKLAREASFAGARGSPADTGRERTASTSTIPSSTSVAPASTAAPAPAAPAGQLSSPAAHSTPSREPSSVSLPVGSGAALRRAHSIPKMEGGAAVSSPAPTPAPEVAAAAPAPAPAPGAGLTTPGKQEKPASTPASSSSSAAPAPAAAPAAAPTQHLGSPRTVVPSSLRDYNAVAALSNLGLLLEGTETGALVDLRPASQRGSPSKQGGGGGGGGFLGFGGGPKKAPTRRLVLEDFRNGGAAATSAADVAVATLVSEQLVSKFNLQSIRLPKNAPARASNVRLFASRGWEAATDLVIIVPAAGMPPGVWDTHTALVSGITSGSLLPYLPSLITPKRGVILLNPYCNHGGDGAVIAGHETPVAHLQSVWDALIATTEAAAAPAASGEEVVASPVAAASIGPAISFIAHGSGADIVLALLTDPTRGISARARTRSIAMLSPKQPPRQVLAAAVSSTGDSGPSRAAAGVLRTQLRQKAMVWHGELRASMRPPAPQADGTIPLEVQELDGNGHELHETLSTPYYSDDYGCHVQNVGLSVPGTAAYREEAQALADGYAPTAVRGNVLSFFDHLMQVDEKSGATKGSATSWVANFKAAAAAKAAAAPAPAPAPTAAAAAGAAVVAADGAAAAAGPAAAGSAAAKPSTPAKVGKSRAKMLMEAANTTANSGEGGAASPAPSAQETAAVPKTPRQAWAEPGAGTGLDKTPAAAASSPAPPAAPAAYVPPAPLPAALAPALERALARLQSLHLDAFAPGGGKEWKVVGVSNGVKAYVMSAEASMPADASPDEGFVGARGDSIIPFPLSAVASLLLADNAARYELDPQLDKVVLVDAASPTARLERLMFKGVYPTSPRDFSVVSSWQVGEDGSLSVFATSTEDSRIPAAKGFVRGRLDIGGWVISPLSMQEYNQAASGLKLKPVTEGFVGACRVAYLFRTSIGGAVPKFIVQQVTGEQAKLPSAVTRILEKKYAGARGAKRLAALAPWTNASGGSDAAAAAPVPAVSSSSEDPSASVASPSASRENTSATTEPVLTEKDAAADDSSKTVAASSSATFNLSGKWKVNRGQSQSLDELLKEMGVPWVARRIANSLEVMTALTHTSESLTIHESSSLGTFKTVLPVNWVPTEETGSDGKKVTRRAASLVGIDEVGENPETVVNDHIARGPPPLPAGVTSYPLFGKGSGVVISIATLPDNLGVTCDERHLVDANKLRLTTVYTRDGAVRAKLVRYLDRLVDEGAAPAAAPAPAPVAASPAPARAPASAAASEAPAPASPSLPPSTPNAAPSTPSALRLEAPVAAGASSTPSEEAAVSTPFKIKPLLADEKAAKEKEAAEAAAAAAAVAASKVQEIPKGISFAKWVPDEEATSCSTCAVPFTTINRVHHCRACGNVFCDACSAARLPLAYLPAKHLALAKVTADQFVRMCSSCATPVIYSATPIGSSGGKVTLTGKNFGSADMASIGRVTAVYVEGGPGNGSIRAKGLVIGPEHTGLSFVMPPGVGTRTLRLEVEGRSGTFNFTYAATVLESAEPAETDGGLTIIRGTNLPGFAAELSSLDIRLNGNPCRAERVVEPFKALQVRVPGGAGGGAMNTITLSASGFPATAPLPFAYAPATLFAGRIVEEPLSAGGLGSSGSASSSSSSSSSSGSGVASVLILYGTSFGSNASAIRVIISGVPCRDVSLLVPHSKIRAVLPESVVTGLQRSQGHKVEVVVEVAGQVSAPFVAPV